MRKEKICKFYYIYIITNILNNKQYVGSHMCYKNNINEDNYWCSSKTLKIERKIQDTDTFKREILKYCNNKKEMLNVETEYILKYNTLAPNGYNRVLPNNHLKFHMGGCKLSEEHKEKIRKSCVNIHKGRKLSQETKNKISKSLTGLKQSSETIEKRVSKIRGCPSKLRGIKLSQETKNKISKNNAKAMLGKHHSDEANEKNRRVHLEKVPWNKNLKGKQTAWNKGKIGVSKETSEKMKSAHKGKPHPNNRRTGFKYKKSIDLIYTTS
jgi:hypothetical protein